MRTSAASRTSTAALLTKGAAWFVGLRWAVRGMGLLSTLILARLLVPSDFGLVSVATSYIVIIEGFFELSLNFALIHDRNAERSQYDTAFTLGAIRGVLVSMLVLVSSLVVPAMIGDPRLSAVITVLAFQPLLLGLINPKFVQFERDIDFSREAILQVGTKLLGVIATITVAVIYRSYWALVAGLIVLAIARVFWSYVLAPYSPRFCLTAFRQLLSFSGWLAGGQMLTTLSTRFDNILVAALVDIEAAGIYNVGMEIARLPYAEIIYPLTRVLFPGFNRFTDTPQKLRANVFEAFQAIATIGIAVGTGFALIADDFIRLVLGQTWEQIIPMVQILSPFLSSEALVAVAVPLAMAVGETRGLFQRALLMALVRPPIFVGGLVLMGYLGGVLGAVVAGLFFLAISMHLIMIILQVPLTRLLQPILRPALAAAATALLVGALDYKLSAAVTQSDLFFELIAKVCAGTVTYCAAILVMWRGAGKPEGLEARVFTLVKSRLF